MQLLIHVPAGVLQAEQRLAYLLVCLRRWQVLLHDWHPALGCHFELSMPHQGWSTGHFQGESFRRQPRNARSLSQLTIGFDEQIANAQNAAIASSACMMWCAVMCDVGRSWTDHSSICSPLPMRRRERRSLKCGLQAWWDLRRSRPHLTTLRKWREALLAPRRRQGHLLTALYDSPRLTSKSQCYFKPCGPPYRFHGKFPAPERLALRGVSVQCSTGGTGHMWHSFVSRSSINDAHAPGAMWARRISCTAHRMPVQMAIRTSYS